jgi:hypothetical protein
MHTGNLQLRGMIDDTKFDAVSWKHVKRSHRRDLHALKAGTSADVVWRRSDSLADSSLITSAILPHHSPPNNEDGSWRLCFQLPLFENLNANMWVRWPSDHHLHDEDNEIFLELMQQRISTLEAAKAEQDFNGCVFRLVETQDDIDNVMSVLHSKFGASGELWYDPSEICESFVKRGVFVIAVHPVDGAVGCVGACSLRGTLFDVRIEDEMGVHETRMGWELTHYAVLGTKGGKYAGLWDYQDSNLHIIHTYTHTHTLITGISSVMQKKLIDVIEARCAEPQLIILDCTFNRNRTNGGNAWLLGLKDERFVYAGCLYRFTSIMCDPNQQSWKDNNHLVVFYYLTTTSPE